jgi:hypothetical protein
MTRTKIIVRSAALSLLAGLGLSTLASAQEPQAPQNFIYATYFQCDVTKQERADEIFKQLDQPIWDASIADGTITGYGYLSHHTGGKWRRAQYYRAPSIEALLAAGDKIREATEAKNKKLNTEFGAICNSHDDYIWSSVVGKNAEKLRGKAAFSVYYECQVDRETQADALVKVVFAPILDKLVADGKLISWTWNEHIVGAQYRRLMSVTAADVNALMQARGSVVEAVEKDPLAGALDSICTSHSDYIWDITAEGAR